MLSDDMKKLTKEQEDIIESHRQDIMGIMDILTIMYNPFIDTNDYLGFPRKTTPLQIGDCNIKFLYELHLVPSYCYTGDISIVDFMLILHCEFRETKLEFRQQIPVSLTDDDASWDRFLEYFARSTNDTLNKILNYIYLETTEKFFKDEETLNIKDKYFNIVKNIWKAPECM
jgi:hypothetical protein